MTPDELRAALAALGLSQVGAARWAGMGERSMREYCSGAVRVPATLAMLIRLTLALNLTPERVTEMTSTEHLGKPALRTHYLPVVAILEELGGNRVERTGLRRLAVAAAERVLTFYEGYTGRQDLRTALSYARGHINDYDEGYSKRRSVELERMPDFSSGVALTNWAHAAAYAAYRTVEAALADHHEVAVKYLFETMIAKAGDDEVARKEAVRATEQWVLKEWAVAQKSDSHRQKQD